MRPVVNVNIALKNLSKLCIFLTLAGSPNHLKNPTPTTSPVTCLRNPNTGESDLAKPSKKPSLLFGTFLACSSPSSSAFPSASCCFSASLSASKFSCFSYSSNSTSPISIFFSFSSYICLVSTTNQYFKKSN